MNFFDCEIQALLMRLSNKQAKKTEAPKKKKHENWFESCNTTQLKDLCKAAKLSASGSKAILVQRLIGNGTTCEYCHFNVTKLKAECKEKLLVQTGNKYDLILRLIQAESGIGSVKRAATETFINEEGEELTVLKKRAKTMLKPESIYNKILKKIHAVQQKKYQTKYGSKDHAFDVYSCLKDVLQTQCIDSKLIETSPVEAFVKAKAALQAFLDHWPYMERPGYSTEDFSSRRYGAMGKLEIVLMAIRSHLTEVQITSMVDLLESIEGAVRGYGLESRDIRRRDLPGFTGTIISGYEIVGNSNCFVDAITLLRPTYDKDKRQRKPSIGLYKDRLGILRMNGIQGYKLPDPPTYLG